MSIVEFRSNNVPKFNQLWMMELECKPWIEVCLPNSKEYGNLNGLLSSDGNNLLSKHLLALKAKDFQQQQKVIIKESTYG